MLQFNGKLALITGAARGNGKAIAREYGGRGAQVVTTDILEDRLAQTTKELNAAGIKAYGYPCELSDDASVKELRAKVIRDAGVTAILHNNAYSTFDAKTTDMAKAFDVSVLGYVRVIQAFLPEMTARMSGHIINTASPLGIVPPKQVANMMAYAIVKAGDISLSQSIVVALEPYNIGVTVLIPELIKTEALDALRGKGNPEFESQFEAFINLSATTPEDAAPGMLDEVIKAKFIASQWAPFQDMLIVYTRNGMDPRNALPEQK
ncbi:hypothetical protein Neosp_003149 [[Neocosmospora] mangrovei]